MLIRYPASIEKNEKIFELFLGWISELHERALLDERIIDRYARSLSTIKKFSAVY
jgi:hypothetical protein